MLALRSERRAHLSAAPFRPRSLPRRAGRRDARQVRRRPLRHRPGRTRGRGRDRMARRVRAGDPETRRSVTNSFRRSRISAFDAPRAVAPCAPCQSPPRLPRAFRRERAPAGELDEAVAGRDDEVAAVLVDDDPGGEAVRLGPAERLPDIDALAADARQGLDRAEGADLAQQVSDVAGEVQGALALPDARPIRTRPPAGAPRPKGVAGRRRSSPRGALRRSGTWRGGCRGSRPGSGGRALARRWGRRRRPASTRAR